MKNYLLRSLPILSFIVLALACQRQLIDPVPTTTAPGSTQPDKMVTSTFQGKVLNEDGEPVKDATVTAGGQTTRTDNHGVFRFTDITTSQQFAYIKAEKPGYFTGSRTVIAEQGGSNFVQIKLLPRKVRGYFQSAESAKITIGNGASVSFRARSIKLKNGATYIGGVNVYAAVIDPTADDFTSTMPGSLRGVRTDNSVTAMISYGMLAVTLTGDGGEELQLDPAHPATITMDIPASLRASAPSSIPLWHFDESDGKWKEEGSALRNGDSYSGLVKHFSFWNYDVPQDFVFLSMKLASAEGAPLAYTTVKLVDASNGSYGIAYSDSTGFLRTWVPKNAVIEINVLSNCQAVLLKTSAGSFATDGDAGTLTVPAAEMVRVTGTAVDCDANPIADGYVNVLVSGLYYRGEIRNGQFSVLVSKCDSQRREASVYGVDNATRTAGASVQVILDEDEVNAGELTVCFDQELKEYIQFTLGGNSYEITNPPHNINYLGWYPGQGSSSRHLLIWGDYDIMDPARAVLFQLESITDTVIVNSNTHFLAKADGINYSSDQGDIDVEVVRFGAVNDYIEVNFNGSIMANSDSSSHPFSGHLRVIRRM